MESNPPPAGAERSAGAGRGRQSSLTRVRNARVERRLLGRATARDMRAEDAMAQATEDELRAATEPARNAQPPPPTTPTPIQLRSRRSRQVQVKPRPEVPGTVPIEPQLSGDIEAPTEQRPQDSSSNVVDDVEAQTAQLTPGERRTLKRAVSSISGRKEVRTSSDMEVNRRRWEVLEEMRHGHGEGPIDLKSFIEMINTSRSLYEWQGGKVLDVVLLREAFEEMDVNVCPRSTNLLPLCRT